VRSILADKRNVKSDKEWKDLNHKHRNRVEGMSNAKNRLLRRASWVKERIEEGVLKKVGLYLRKKSGLQKFSINRKFEKVYDDASKKYDQAEKDNDHSGRSKQARRRINAFMRQSAVVGKSDPLFHHDQTSKFLTGQPKRKTQLAAARWPLAKSKPTQVREGEVVNLDDKRKAKIKKFRDALTGEKYKDKKDLKELSSALIGRYQKKAKRSQDKSLTQIKKHVGAYVSAKTERGAKAAEKRHATASHTYDKRDRGMKMADTKIFKRGLDKAIAKVSKKEAAKASKQEFEKKRLAHRKAHIKDLFEISKELLKRYSSKALDDADRKDKAADASLSRAYIARRQGNETGSKEHWDKTVKFRDLATKRRAGIAKAGKKMVKE
jgi:hypothetical protein